VGLKEPEVTLDEEPRQPPLLSPLAESADISVREPERLAGLTRAPCLRRHGRDLFKLLFAGAGQSSRVRGKRLTSLSSHPANCAAACCLTESSGSRSFSMKKPHNAGLWRIASQANLHAIRA
jgi:hypothetical protein